MALCEGFFVSRQTIMDLISHHQDNLGRAVLALSFWAPSGGGDSQPDFADQLALPSKASLDNDDAWSKVRQLLLGSATSLPMIDRPLPLVGVAEYFGFDPATKAPVLPTTSPTDFLQCPPGMECFRLKLLRATLFLSSGAFELTRVAEDPLVFFFFFFFSTSLFYPLSSVRHFLPSFPHRLAFSTGAW